MAGSPSSKVAAFVANSRLNCFPKAPRASCHGQQDCTPVSSELGLNMERFSNTARQVPKFASFKPKPKEASTKLEEAKATPAPHAPRKDSHIHGDRRRHKHHARSSRELSLRHSPAVSEHTAPDLPAAPPAPSERVFFSDRKGDKENVTYGSLHRYSVPPFSRSGGGRVVGLPAFARIDRELSNEKQTVVRTENLDRGLRSRKGIWSTIPARDEIRIRPAQNPLEEDHNSDFLLLRPRKRRRLLSESSDSGNHDSDDVESRNYRSIEGKATAKEYDSDPDTESATRHDVDGGARKKGVELSRIAEKEPQNGQAWLDLIDHQDVEQAQRQVGLLLTLAERQSLAKIKLSMISKALQRVQRPDHRELLLIRSVEEAARITDPTQMHKKWQEVLRDNPHMARLWIPYLNFLQTTFSTFHFDDLREAFSLCLKALDKIRSNRNEQGNMHVHVYLLLRMTVCIRDAGFVEQAVAIWQATLELNFFRPPNLDGETPPRKLMELLEEFWESEVPRLGEKGAQGWSAYSLDDGYEAEAAETASVDHHASVNIKSWYEREDNATARSRMPSRSLDGESYDPYRVVLFSDIRDYVPDIPAQDHDLLVHAFLAFCGLPPLQSASDVVRTWWRDPVLHSPDSLRIDGPSESTGPEDTSPSNIANSDSLRPLTQSALCCPKSCLAISPDTLFADPSAWFSATTSTKVNPAESKNRVSLDWVRQTLRTLVDHDVCGEDLAEALLSLEHHSYPASVRKTAKALLKRRPSSLRLYNTYALVEHRLGNETAGDNVFLTAIGMSGSQPDCVLLWRSWILEALFNGNQAEAFLRLLALSSDGQKVSNARSGTPEPADIFEAQTGLIACRDKHLNNKELGRAASYIECLIFLSYLSSETPLEAALSIFNSNLSIFPTIGPVAQRYRELFHQTFARLLYHHVTHHSRFRPSLVRNFLSDSIDLFPENTIFLSLFAWNEARFRVDDRVRSVIQTQLRSPTHGVSGRQESYILLLFAVHLELSRAVARGSNVHSIRSAFERAVGSDAAKHSPALWKWYFDFEVSRNEKVRAKAAFYRAIRICPWAKELYSLPFRSLVESMDTEELRGCYQLMLEKELRVHIPLDETATANGKE